MDHREVQYGYQEPQFPRDRELGVPRGSVYFRCEDHRDRGRKCSQRSGCTLYRKPQKLLRHHCDLRARTASYRIYRKKELLKVPLLSIWMKYLHCLFLDREDIKQGLQTILTAIDKIKSGISIFVFPEGTRNKVEGTFLPFHEGCFKNCNEDRLSDRSGNLIQHLCNLRGSPSEDQKDKYRNSLWNTVLCEGSLQRRPEAARCLHTGDHCFYLCFHQRAVSGVGHYSSPTGITQIFSPGETKNTGYPSVSCTYRSDSCSSFCSRLPYLT